MCTYYVVQDACTEPEFAGHTYFGICAIENESGRPREIMRIPDLFFRRDKAEKLAVLCNSLNLSPIHFREVAEDIIDT